MKNMSKKNQIMKSFTFLMTLGLGLASATALDGQKKLDEKIETMESRAGLEVFGAIHSEFLRSEVEGDFTKNIDPSVMGKVDRYSEKMEKTQVTRLDLGLNFRPFENTQAKAIMRFSQDWQTFFASRSRPVGVRWLSMDGKFNKMVSFNVGDFKQKYSPLTLWSPELEFILEPKIFGRDRQELMDEHFLSDNERVLQGANLNISIPVVENVAELRIDGLFSRVRRSEFLDNNGKQSKESNFKSDLENFVGATQIEVLAMNNVFIGGGFLFNYDQAGTFLNENQIVDSLGNLSYAANGIDFNSDTPEIDSIPAGYSYSQNGNYVATLKETKVVSGKAGVDIAGFVGLDFLTAEVLAEFAQSTQSFDYVSSSAEDAAIVLSENITGTAMWTELGLGYTQGDVDAQLKARMIQNQAAFSNPFAQSTSWVPERIMNTSNDNGSNALYSSLDALYHGVSHYSPTIYETANQNAPYEKNSYTNSIQYGQVASDPALQSVLPNGLATANRKGITANLTSDYLGGGTKVEVAYKGLKSNEATGAILNSTYDQVGFGVGVDVSKFLAGYDFPLELTAAVTKDDITHLSLLGAQSNITNALFQAGIYLKVHRLFAVLGGYQQLKSDTEQLGVSMLNVTESYWRGGVEFSIGENAYFVTSVGQVDVEQAFTPALIGNPATIGEFSQFITQFKIHADF